MKFVSAAITTVSDYLSSIPKTNIFQNVKKKKKTLPILYVFNISDPEFSLSFYFLNLILL